MFGLRRLQSNPPRSLWLQHIHRMCCLTRRAHTAVPPKKGTHGVRSAWGHTQHSHRLLSFSFYVTRSRTKRIQTRPLTCTNRQARRSLRSSPCDSNSVFEWAHTVYKNASNRLKSSANARSAISPAQRADITVEEHQYHCAIRKLKI